MGFDAQKHHRRSIRLVDYDYAGLGAYFITVCVHDRESLFGDIVEVEIRLNRWGEIADECWRAIPVHFENVELDAFVVMPNHVHGIIVIADVVGATHASPLRDASPPPGASSRPDAVPPPHASPSQHASSLQSPLPTIPNGPKPRSIGAIIGSYKSGVSKRINETRATPGQPVWQRNNYEHVIRDEAELARIREYIETNPARWTVDRENPHGKTK